MMQYAHAIIGGILFASVLPTCNAEENSIYKIEEDWEMVINEPDPANNSPQVTFYTCPTADPNVYFQLQMNYAADSEYSEGGFHVAAVEYDQFRDEARSSTRSPLTSDQDHIRWTSVMAVVDGKVLFAVKDGHGDDWGDFGGPDYLVRLESSPVSDLSEYHPQKSLDAVDVGFGANRVASITLRKVRVYYTNGNTVSISVNRHPQ